MSEELERKSLYEMFMQEKERVGDQFVLFYDKVHNCLQYKSEEGTLSVFFKDNKEEEIYYKENSVKKGFGTKVGFLSDYGNEYTTMGGDYNLIPEGLIDVMSSYSYFGGRKHLNLEKKVTKDKHKDFER